MVNEFLSSLEDILGTEMNANEEGIFVTTAFGGTMIAASEEVADEAGFGGRYMNPATYMQWWKAHHGNRLPQPEYAGEGFVQLF